MTPQPTLFGSAPPARDRAAEAEWLRDARLTAASIASQRGKVCTDDLQKVLDPPPGHVNAWGSVLKGPWFFPGGEVPSRRKAAHKRTIHWWYLTATGKATLT